MAKVKKSCSFTETQSYWVLGTKPGGKFLLDVVEHVSPEILSARKFFDEAAALETLHLGLKDQFEERGRLKPIRVRMTVEEYANGRD